MPDPLSRSKYYRDRAAEYLALEETTTGEYFKQSCRTIADHFVTLATIEVSIFSGEVQKHVEQHIHLFGQLCKLRSVTFSHAQPLKILLVI